MSRYEFAHKLPKRRCPECGHKRFRTYIDIRTAEELDGQYGICDRINSCGYHCVPPMPGKEERVPITRARIPPPERTDWRCPPEAVEATSSSAGNVFARWMVGIMGPAASKVLRAYGVGTYPQSNRHPELSGAMVYWQIGADGTHRSGKVIPYGPDGNRIKEHGATWIHTILYGKSSKELGVGQVLFGEHLLPTNTDKTVCVVESEKSALICAVIYPQYLWLATGGSHQFTVSMCMCLSDRDVIVIPDIGMYEEWSDKAVDISVICRSMVVSDYMEASGMEEGADIADLLLAGEGFVFPDIPEAAEVVEELPPELAIEPIETPIDRIMKLPGVTTLAAELDLDMTAVRAYPINGEQTNQDNEQEASRWVRDHHR